MGLPAMLCPARLIEISSAFSRANLMAGATSSPFAGYTITAERRSIMAIPNLPRLIVSGIIGA
jgi:hypothetical protein